MVRIVQHKLNFNYDKLIERKLSKIYLIILHHTASPSATVEGIHSDHLKRGWAGIGYHFLIQPDGTIDKGRGIEYVGSHCAGNNTSSIGIALVGDFRRTQPTEKQLESLSELIQFMKKHVPSIKRVLNHNDLYKTLCPVVDLKSLVKDKVNE